jgi:hypothetical protein
MMAFFAKRNCLIGGYANFIPLFNAFAGFINIIPAIALPGGMLAIGNYLAVVAYPGGIVFKRESAGKLRLNGHLARGIGKANFIAIYNAEIPFRSIIRPVIKRENFKQYFFVPVDGNKAHGRIGNQREGFKGIGKTHGVFAKGNNGIAFGVYVAVIAACGVYNAIQIVVCSMLWLAGA